jgi:hypothetical protein
MDGIAADCTRRLGATIAVALTAVTLAACSSSAKPGSPAPNTGPVTTSPGASTSGGVTSPVPDPCSLTSADQIRTITGEDPGTPSSSRSGAIFPTERTCSWDPVITFVGLATDFPDLKQSIEHDFGPVQSVPGVGQEAFWDAQGKVLAAHDARFLVIAELSGMGSTDSDAEQIARCKQILTTMLSNA